MAANAMLRRRRPGGEAVDDELRSILRETAGQSGDALQETTDQIHDTSADDVGDGADQQQRTAASEGLDRLGPNEKTRQRPSGISS